jgi:hypothetical protein
MTPFQAPVLEAAYGILTSGAMDSVADSVGGSYLFGNNPKLQTFGRELVNWFVPQKGMEKSELQSTARAGLDLFAGMSNVFKAWYIMQAGQVKSASGQIVDYDSDWVTAAMAIAGIETMDAVKSRSVNTVMYDKEQGWKSDMDEAFKVYVRQMNIQGRTLKETETIQRAFAMGFELYRHDPQAMAYWNSKLEKSITANELDVYNRMWENLNKYGIDDTIELVKQLPDSTTQKQDMLTALERAKELGNYVPKDDE